MLKNADAGRKVAEKRGDFTLESVTADEIASEKKKQADKAEIERRAAEPIKGGTVNVQPEMDLGDGGSGDLFSPVADAKPTAKSKNEENTAAIDRNGNPVDENGKRKVHEVKRISDISDNDFTAPTKTIKLPNIPKNVDAAIGANGKSVIIKKNIFEKNRRTHPELDPATSKSILEQSLYNPNLVGQSQPSTKPNYKVAIHTGDKNAVTILDITQEKDHVEIVGWRNIDENGFVRLKRQSAREGGQFLILHPSEEGQPDALSGRPSGQTSDSISRTDEKVKSA